MKIGMECEGRYKGLPTLFMTAEEYLAGMQIYTANPSLQAMMDYPRHIYVSDHKGKINTENLVGFWSMSRLITIEVTKCPKNRMEWPRNVTFMLTLPVDKNNFFGLRDMDQVKFSKQLTVYVADKDTMMKTFPKDFAGDVKVKIRNVPKVLQKKVAKPSRRRPMPIVY
jgi:hypothetical protein